MNSDTAYNFVFVCSTIFTLLIQSDITGNVYIWAKLAISQPLLSLLKELIENILHIIEYRGQARVKKWGLFSDNASLKMLIVLTQTYALLGNSNVTTRQRSGRKGEFEVY